jgi:putative Holliday junction resolvase
MPDQPGPGTYLGIDYGHKRIGIAVGQTITRSASALEIIQTGNKDQWQQLGSLIQQWQPAGIVVGMPETADGNTGKLHTQINQFIKQLSSRFSLPVHTIDERLSSYAARDLLSQSTNRKIAPVDDMAAAVILQTWLDEQYDNS